MKNLKSKFNFKRGDSAVMMLPAIILFAAIFGLIMLMGTYGGDLSLSEDSLVILFCLSPFAMSLLASIIFGLPTGSSCRL